MSGCSRPTRTCTSSARTSPPRSSGPRRAAPIPRTECLANGGWNFDWQRTYQYDAPLDLLPSVTAGDVIDIKCKWDNTLENPFVQRMLTDSNLPPQPIDITLGEQTTNEMCLEIFGLSIPAPPKRAIPDDRVRDPRPFARACRRTTTPASQAAAATPARPPAARSHEPRAGLRSTWRCTRTLGRAAASTSSRARDRPGRGRAMISRACR